MLLLCQRRRVRRRRCYLVHTEQRLLTRDKTVLLEAKGKGSLITYFDSFGNSSHKNPLALFSFFSSPTTTITKQNLLGFHMGENEWQFCSHIELSWKEKRRVMRLNKLIGSVVGRVPMEGGDSRWSLFSFNEYYNRSICTVPTHSKGTVSKIHSHTVTKNYRCLVPRGPMFNFVLPIDWYRC